MSLLRLGDRSLEIGEKPIIVGILNVTPDSFSDGGVYASVESSLTQVARMIGEGACVIDVGGESTRPGAEPVSAEVECERVVPVIESISKKYPDALVSIDTSKSAVARAAAEAGACIVNDVTGFQGDPDMASVVSKAEVGCVLMFNARMSSFSDGIVARAQKFWNESLALAKAAGIGDESIILDPGIGFGTTREEDLEMLANLRSLRLENYPILLGASRKRVTGEFLNLSVEDRLETTLATTVAGVESGVEMFRVHDVRENFRAARMAKLMYGYRNG